MSTRPEFGEAGVVALLTPGGNPTAEPELSVLLGADMNLLTVRMHDPAPDMMDRLRGYAVPMEHWLAPLTPTPLDAIVFACTGSAYLDHAVGAGAPATIAWGGLEVPLVTAAGAIEAAFTELGARSIGLVSPYPAALTDEAVAYWRGRGLAIKGIATVAGNPRFHPIYAQRQSAVLTAIRQARAFECDTVLVTGTGAPSLGALLIAASEPGPPVISSNLAMGWRLRALLSGAGTERLSRWLGSEPVWAQTLRARFPAAMLLAEDS